MADTLKGGAGAQFGRLSPWAWIRSLADNDCGILCTNDVPSNGTSGTGAKVAGKGCLLVDITHGTLYQNTNTKASPTWTLIEAAGAIPLANGDFFVGNSGGIATAVAPTGDVTFSNAGVFVIGAGKVTSAMLAASVIQSITGSIASATITGTSAGQLGHANGVVLVPAAAAGAINELVSAVVAMDFLTAAYTGGGNVTVNLSGGGVALTGLVATANFIQVSADKIIEFVPLAATFNNYGTGANGLALVSSVAPTNPGTAAGIINYQVNYRTIPSLLD